MNLLKTFFGMILRKTDVDFQNLGSRKLSVQTHVDYTVTNGGVINGLDAFLSQDGKSVLITPGVFYSQGEFVNQNAVGGGERCEVYVTQTISNLPETTPLNGVQRYILIYATVLSQNSNPDLTKSQVVVTSRNFQTGENTAVREYNRASIAVSDQISIVDALNIDAVPLALVQVAADGTITLIDTTVKLDYAIADLINIPKQKIANFGIDDNFVKSAMISGNQVLSRHLRDGVITSPKLGAWDGTSSGNTSGFGVATEHLKHDAVTSDKISSTGSLYGFSPINHVFNSSFEIVPNTAAEGDLVGWQTFNEASSDVGYSGITAGVFRTNTESYNGSHSVVMQGADPTLTTGGVVKGVAIYQDILFPDEKLNNKDVTAFFYMKTDNNYPANIPGISGMTASIQFLSSGVPIGSQYQIANYSGAIIDWTKFETPTPVKYTDSTSADGIRFLVSGNLTNAVDVFVDNFYVGITNLTPAWQPSPEDANYSDTLNKANINTVNLNSTNADYVNINAINIIPSISAGTGISISSTSSTVAPYLSSYTNNLTSTITRTTGSSFYFAQPFTSTTATTIDAATIRAGIGIGSGILSGALVSTNLLICANITVSGGSAGLQGPDLSNVIGTIGTSLVAASSTAKTTDIVYVGGSATIAAATPYWIVFEVPFSYLQIGKIYVSGATGNGCIISKDGATWSTTLDTNTYIKAGQEYLTFGLFYGMGMQSSSTYPGPDAGYTWASPSLQVTNITTMSKAVYALYNSGATSAAISTSAGSSVSSVGSYSEPFGLISSNNVIVNGQPVSINSKQFKVVTSGIDTWTVPAYTTSIVVELVGGGGGGTAGATGPNAPAGGVTAGAGGGGGGSGEYVRQRLSVTPGDVLTIQVGPGGAGGIGQVHVSAPVPPSSYFGQDGRITRIIKSPATELVRASGGLGATPGSIDGGKYGAGTTSYSSDRISIAGTNGTNGGLYYAPQLGTTGTNWLGVAYDNGGGIGASLDYLYFKGQGGSGGQGFSRLAQPVGWLGYQAPNVAQKGKDAIGIGSGGGGGGGAYGVNYPPDQTFSMGGPGGQGSNGIAIIYF